VHYIWTAQGKILVATSREVETEYRVSESTLLRWEGEGMPVCRQGRSKLFPIAAVRGWVAQNHGAEIRYGRRYPPLGI